MIDYALWEVIENGATLPKTQVVDGVTTVMPITTAEEKAQRRLKEKARSNLIIGIPNEHQLKFNSIKDVKQLLKTVEKRFKWNTHVFVWRNKANLDTMSMDDLYNNLKVHEPEVKRMSSSNSNTQNMAFLSSINSNTNAALNTANEVSTTRIQFSDTFFININLSDVVIYAFMASQPNSRQLAHEDLEQIHPDDMEEMDLRWQMAMFTMRAKRFLKKANYYKEIDGGYVAFGGNPKGGKITTKDHLRKCDGTANEGFFVGYLLNSKTFRVFNSRTRIVEEYLHIRFSENTPNVIGSRPNWLFDIDALTRTMNYEPIVASTQSNVQNLKSSHEDEFKPSCDNGKKFVKDLSKENECNDQEKEDNVKSTNNVNTISLTINVVSTIKNNELPFDLNMPACEDVNTFNFSSDDEDDGTMADMNNLDTTIQVSHVPTTRIHKDHPLD
uniref:Retroviral polymerase SH3-like domain-containing protein n=1 Tax=Tanacetum cinerariifolium TaxID=118510 RepID=A0A699GQ76_TANCI|nr:hypothetical protein [Tanacetum cinerariifolium]